MTAAELCKLAQAKGVKIATAESCTGGMIGAAITDIPGSSLIFDRGFITYSNLAKIQMLNVRETTLSDHGAVSEQTAAEMAQGALLNSAADISVSVTGIAGPGGSEHKPEGRVCFGLATKSGVITETVDFGAIGRAEVRRATVQHALNLLAQALTR